MVTTNQPAGKRAGTVQPSHVDPNQFHFGDVPESFRSLTVGGDKEEFPQLEATSAWPRPLPLPLPLPLSGSGG